jgi:demethylmenaquinone methyltransferase/2-methoxy-6-polyprenyl-1,4-benzoquinol methylase
MDKQKIAAFFDSCASWWDADMIRNEEIIAKILDNGGIRPGVHVLDVACGTGVLFPDYLHRDVASVTAIDISPEMAKIAQSKFPQVKVICGDVETEQFEHPFDCIMVYNAFPHFKDPEHLVEVLARLLKPGGRLSVAHGMSREALMSHHAGRASDVSIDLVHELKLKQIFSKWFDVDVVISNDHMYQVSGVRLAECAVPGDGAMKEMLALMRYMVSHNDAHAQELAELAENLKELGRTDCYKQIMDAVADFDVANARLGAVLKDLE